MSPPFVLHNSLGAMYIGMVLGTSLHGISVVQTWYYYTHQNDKWPLKSLVTAVMVCNTVHQVVIIYSVYFYTLTNWGNPEQLSNIVRSLVVEVLFNALITLLVQSFLTVRLWRFSNHILLTTLTVVIVLAEFATSLAFVVLVLQRETFAQLRSLKSLALTVNALTAVGDVVIAGALCTMLHLSRTGVHRSDTMINKLILFAVNTGLLTGLFAIASLVSYVAAPNTLIYIAFYFCIGGLYTNALLANLNARKIISSNLRVHPMDTHDDMTMSLGELPKNRSTSRRGTASLSIKINTTREFVTDLMDNQEQDHDNDKVPISSSTSVDGLEVKNNNI